MRSFHVTGRKIIAVAANYRPAGMGASHVEGRSGEPVFFLKPTSSYVLEPHPIRLPAQHRVVHEGAHPHFSPPPTSALIYHSQKR